MKHQYPVRHPDVPRAVQRGETTSVQNQGAATAAAGSDPQMPHEHDESSHSQASATTRHDEVGRHAYRNATDGTSDTDRGPLMDKVYNDKLAPNRRSTTPRR